MMKLPPLKRPPLKLPSLKMRLLTAGICAAAVPAALAISVVAHEQSKTPSWVGDQSACRANPMTHVHTPQRLDMLAPCATITGTVQSVRFVPAFDDLKITLVPDDSLRPLLEPANHGVVVADVIATDLTAVSPPTVGSRISCWGSWVLDRGTKSVQLLPTYRVTPAPGSTATAAVSGHSTEKHGPPPNRQLKLSITAARRVVVGSRIDVDVAAQWARPGRSDPASEIRLFAEMSTANGGTGVRWKAAMTDTRGTVHFSFVAIQVPTEYTITVYATPSGQNLSASAPVLVAKA